MEVFNMLHTLGTTKACGPDGITGKMFKMTASSVNPACKAICILTCSFQHNYMKIVHILPTLEAVSQTQNN